MKRKVLIIGSMGMAGHVLLHHFRNLNSFDVADIARSNDGYQPSYNCDITDFNRLKEILLIEKPEFVINCIGVLNKDAEDHPEKAILINSYFPHYLAKTGNEMNFKLIHISTDCVFSGGKGNYKEDDFKDGKGFYAQSKSLGEVVYGNHLTIRTSIIGPELKKNGIGLFHWFMEQHGEIKGFTEAMWTGVTTFELAKAVRAAMDQNIHGLYHLVNDEKISKYELLNLFQQVFQKQDVKIVPYNDYKVDKSLIRTNRSFSYTVPSYLTMLLEMKEKIAELNYMYPQYSLSK